MNTTTLIQTAWTKAEGEVFSDVVGSDNWNYLFTLANYYINYWATQAGVDWNSLYNPFYEIGKVTATNSFDIDTTEVRKFSPKDGDTVRISHSDSINYTDYSIINADSLRDNPDAKVCARVGSTLVFPKSFKATDAQFGGTITAPIYTYPEQLTSATSTVPVDNPNWLVCMIAYDVALHDILRKDIAGNLLNEANDIFSTMKADNDGVQDYQITGDNQGADYVYL